MTSGSDDLEQELRRNLKLRLELGAEAAKGKAALNAKERGGRLPLGFCIGLVSRSLVCMQLSFGGLTRRIFGGHHQRS